MREKISINQVEKVTGVAKRNIRFYEKEGLLLPKRDSGNGYRVYDETDIWRIKVIKMLRMLDMPLEEIKKVLEEDRLLSEAIENQQTELERKAKELQAAIQFCEHMKNTELDSLDVDNCLNYIEKSGKEGFFQLWVEDYKKVKDANRDMDFTFVPDVAITNEREFTDALFQYANQENINLVITKESMYPEFTIDGVEYTAERYYTYMNRVPTAIVCCHQKDREVEGEGISESRKSILWFVHKWGWAVGMLVVDLILLFPLLALEGTWWEKVVVVVGLLLVEGCMLYRQSILHYNDKTK